MSDLGKRINKILTIFLGIALVVAVVLIIVAFALGEDKYKVAAIIITIIVCVIAFISEIILKRIFKSEEKETIAE